jgi:hypothetical protein
MDLFQLIVVIVILGLGMYLIERYVPMAQPFRILLRVLVVLLIVLWLLQVFGITGPRVPRL